MKTEISKTDARKAFSKSAAGKARRDMRRNVYRQKRGWLAAMAIRETANDGVAK